MIRKILKITLMAVLVLLPANCSLIYEDDLSEEIVYVIMPVDGTTSSLMQQVFWWETVEGAIKYRLQIVEGDFLDPHALVADTNVSGDKFQVVLPPGGYEWRIRGWNNFSETDFFYSLLTISDTSTVYEE